MLGSPAAGSYVALTVLGRPPGLPLQEEEELEDTDVMEEGELSSCLPTLPVLSARQQGSLESTGLQDNQINYGSAEGVRTDPAPQVFGTELNQTIIPLTATFIF